MEKLVVASNNSGKLKEIRAILNGKFEVVTMRDAGVSVSPEETGNTFEENAVIKAKALYDVIGCPTISDDSGLCVDALGGAPGVFSARYAGEDCDDKRNNRLLLENMKGVKDRRAAFVSCVCLYFGNDKFITVYGRTKGEILTEPRGDGGFGYDPLFYSYDLGKSFGEATSDEKNSVSHRARALQALAERIENNAK